MVNTLKYVWLDVVLNIRVATVLDRAEAMIKVQKSRRTLDFFAAAGHDQGDVADGSSRSKGKENFFSPLFCNIISRVHSLGSIV